MLKKFYGRKLKFFLNKLESLSLASHFRIVVFTGKAGVYPSETRLGAPLFFSLSFFFKNPLLHLSVHEQLRAPLLGRLLALFTNNRLGRKGLPELNTLAHYKSL